MGKADNLSSIKLGKIKVLLKNFTLDKNQNYKELNIFLRAVGRIKKNLRDCENLEAKRLGK